MFIQYTFVHASSGYAHDLMSLVFEDVVPSPQAYLEELQKIPVPPPLCSAFIHPPMDEAVAAYKSRFSQAQP